MEIILASASPRRKKLLKEIIRKFKVIPAYIDENMTFNKKGPHKIAENLALKKAEIIAKKYPSALVIGADTVVEMPEIATVTSLPVVTFPAETVEEIPDKIIVVLGTTLPALPVLLIPLIGIAAFGSTVPTDNVELEPVIGTTFVTVTFPADKVVDMPVIATVILPASPPVVPTFPALAVED